MIDIHISHDKNFKQFIHMKLREYNDNNSTHHKAYRKDGEIKSISLEATKDGVCIGGIIAELYWGWLNIDFLWIEEQFRGFGIGSKLLSEIEKLAKSNGCDKVQLFTFEFQGRDFYQKHGYEVIGTLNDYPPGSNYYWMKKIFK